MYRKLVARTMLIFIWLTACRATEPEWQTFTSEPGNFSVNVPGALLESTHTTPTPLGQIESYVFTLHRGAFGYAIAYADYPVRGAARANPSVTLEGAVQRTLDSYSAKLATKQNIELDYIPGVEFRGTFLGGNDSKDAGIVYGRLYLYNARIYQLAVLTSQDQLEIADPERFFASFQWLRSGVPRGGIPE